MRNHIAIAICLLSSLGCTTFGTAQSSNFADNFYTQFEAGGNFNWHRDLQGHFEVNQLRWLSFGIETGYRNRFFAAGIGYEFPWAPIHPPKKSFHLYFAHVRLNLLSVANKEFAEKHFFGPLIFTGQTTGYQDLDINGSIEFDDKITAFGLFYSQEIKPAVRLCVSAYQYSFIDEIRYANGQQFEQDHRNRNISVGIILNPITLIAEKRQKKKSE